MDRSDSQLKTSLIQLLQQKWILTFSSIQRNFHLENDDIKLVQETLKQLVNDNQVGMKIAKSGSNKGQSIYYWQKGIVGNVNYPSPSNYKRGHISNVANSSKKRRSIGLAPASRTTFCSPLLKKSPRQGSVDKDESSTQPLQYHEIASTSHAVDTSKAGKENLPISKYELHDLIDSKAKLIQAIQEKENKLRKLKLVKMYHSKINLNNLDQLITKWRTISQDVAQQLLEKIQIEPRPTMAQFLDAYHIDLDLIQYSVEDEAFTEK